MPPITPGIASARKIRLSMSLNAACENADTPVVATSAACTVADDIAGGTPSARSTVLEMTP